MKTFIISLKVLLVFTVITGLLYPLLVTGIAQACFSRKANGSMIMKNGHAIGSELIGQSFDSSKYFFSRPSFTFYDPMPGGASNYALASRVMKEEYVSNKRKFIDANRLDSNRQVPAEMLFSSASGLDPHISPQAALLQVERIAKARHFDARQKQELIRCISELTEPRQLKILGEERINVLLLNLRTDQIK